jgi:hypothetical protein
MARICGIEVRVPGYRSRGPRFDSRLYQIFWEVVGRERGPFSLVSTTQKLHGRKSSSSSLEKRENGRRDPSRWPRDTTKKLALTSPTSGGRSVGIVRSRTRGTEFVSFICLGKCRYFYSSIFLVIGTRWKWIVSFTPLLPYYRRKIRWYSLDKRLVGPQSRSGRCGEEKNLAFQRNETGPTNSQPVNIRTKLSRLLRKTQTTGDNQLKC